VGCPLPAEPPTSGDYTNVFFAVKQTFKNFVLPIRDFHSALCKPRGASRTPLLWRTYELQSQGLHAYAFGRRVTDCSELCCLPSRKCVNSDMTRHVAENTSSVAALFTPFILNGVTLPNRIVMAPMTRNFSPCGVPGRDVAAYYRRRAEGGVGLILTEGTAPNHPQATNMPQIPHLYGDEALAGWANVVSQVRAAGGRIFSQIWHVGAVQGPGGAAKLPEHPVSPSGYLKPEVKIGEPLTVDDIESLIRAYGDAAEAAQRTGFCGIEIHGAHGYLIDQFFWDGTNRCADEYGGDIAQRTRFAAEIIRECRRRTGKHFPIVLRFSQWKLQDYSARLAQSPQELARFLEPLAAAGLDAFHCSTRRFWEPEFEGSDLNLAGWAKKITGLPTITVGSVALTVDFVDSFRGVQQTAENGAGRTAHIDRLVEMLVRGDFDLVAVGRALLADPEWPVKIRDARFDEIRVFTPEALKTLV
jgi:2,4-dienoyl-CoA reductase-like NADH-dependent reductase (Old Yellow Enzyme family)